MTCCVLVTSFRFGIPYSRRPTTMLQRCCLQPMFSGCVVSFVGESTPTLLGDELGPFAIQSVSTVSVASGQKIKKWPLPNYCRALLSIFDSSFVGICLTSTFHPHLHLSPSPSPLPSHPPFTLTFNLTSTLHPHLHPSPSPSPSPPPSPSPFAFTLHPSPFTFALHTSPSLFTLH